MYGLEMISVQSLKSLGRSSPFQNRESCRDSCIYTHWYCIFWKLIAFGSLSVLAAITFIPWASPVSSSLFGFSSTDSASAGVPSCIFPNFWGFQLLWVSIFVDKIISILDQDVIITTAIQVRWDAFLYYLHVDLTRRSRARPI